MESFFVKNAPFLDDIKIISCSDHGVFQLLAFSNPVWSFCQPHCQRAPIRGHQDVEITNKHDWLFGQNINLNKTCYREWETLSLMLGPSLPRRGGFPWTSICILNQTKFTLLPCYRFGWFYKRNGTTWSDGQVYCNYYNLLKLPFCILGYDGNWQ